MSKNNLNARRNKRTRISVQSNKRNSDSNKNVFSGKTASLLDAFKKDSNDNRSKSEMTSEALVAFTDEDSSARYIRLQSKGINILRGEIISISEYIPIADTKSNNSTYYSQSLSDSSKPAIDINNVYRLIELHRQIRSYVLNAADKVLLDVYPDLYNKDFINLIEIQTKKMFSANVKSTVEKTIDSLMIALQSNAESTKNLTSSNFQRILKENKNNLFLKGMMEFFVYSNIIEEIILYLGTIAQLDEEMKKHWSIEKFNDLQAFSPENIFEDSDIKSLYKESVISDMKNKTNITNNLICIDRSTSNSDTDMLCNTLSHLVSLLTFRDSLKILESTKNSNSDIKKIKPKEIRIGLNNDLYKAATNIKNINLQGFIASLGAGTSIEREGAGSVYSSSKKLNDDDFFGIFKSIKTFDDLGKKAWSMEGAAELVALMSYDIIVGNIIRYDSNKLIKSFSSSNNLLNINSSEIISSDRSNQFFKYLEMISGIPSGDLVFIKSKQDKNTYINRVAGVPEDKNTNNIEGYGTFVKKIAGYRTDKNESGVRYLPLESTNKEKLFSGNKDYETATKYFIERSIERSGITSNPNIPPTINFNELEEYSKDYLKCSNVLTSQILTLVPNTKLAKTKNSIGNMLSPLGDISSLTFVTELLEELIDDIEYLIECTNESNGDSNKTVAPILACMLRETSTAYKKKDFLGTFWSSILFSAGDENDREFMARSNNYRKKVLGRFFDFYHNQSAYNFLKSNCGYSFDNNDGANFEFKGGSGIEYRAYIRGGSENIINRSSFNDASFNKFVNEQCDSTWDASSGNGIVTLTMTRDKLHKKFAKSFGSGDDDLYRFRDGDIANVATKSSFRGAGFGRIFFKSMNKAIKGSFKKDDELINFNNELYKIYENEVAEDGKDLKLKDDFARKGNIANFSGHHRALIWYMWAYNLLRKSVNIKIIAGDKKLQICINTNQLQGVIDGIKKSLNKNVSSNNSTRAYKESLQLANNNTNDLINKIKGRESLILQVLGLFSAHSHAIKSSKEKVVKALDGEIISGNLVTSELKEKRKLAINILKQNNIFIDSIVLNNDTSPSLIAKSYEKNLTRKVNTLFNKDLFYTQSKMKFIYKVLSQEGYGLITDEKRGNKSILNVGIPNSMLAYLRKEAFEETKNVKFSNSPYVCISVYKKSHLYPELSFLPRNFIFDTNADIFDLNPTTGKLSSHLKDIPDNISFDNLLKKVDITRYRLDNEGKIIKNTKKGYPAGIFDKDILINHVFDYSLKEYQKLTTGLNVSEDSFLLTNTPIDFDTINYTSYTTADLEQEYLKILSRISDLYPEINQDDQLKSEVFRLTKVIKQSLPFSHVNFIKKTITPKTFDKVYSILINEKDFLIETENNIFGNNVIYNYNSRLIRPEKVSLEYQNVHSLGTINGSGYVFNFDKNIKNYIKSIDNNYPDVFNYTISVSLLPIDFMSDSDYLSKSTIDFNKENIFTKSNLKNKNNFRKDGKNNQKFSRK